MIIPYLTQSTSPSLSKNNTGLGNALFQIFTAYGLSKTYDHTFNNYYLKELLFKLEQFSLNHDKTIYRNLKYFSKIKKIDTEVWEKLNYYGLYDKNIVEQVKNVKDDTNICLKGYLQSHLYFDNYYNDIIELIKPDENSLRLIKTKYSHLFDDNIINISLHFRLDWGVADKFKYHNDYYHDSIIYIQNILKNENSSKKIILNIFSDVLDKNQVKNFLNYDKCECIYFENNEDYIDLWSMSLCRFNVLSNSTLSWWGAYINISKNKIVIYPEDLLRLLGGTIYDVPKYPARLTEHYKKEWVGLDTKNVISRF